VLTQRFVRALDWLLIVPLSAIEPVQARGRRPRFGRLGDVRVKLDGHFEYRTLPNWMVERTLAQGVMTLLTCVVRMEREIDRVIPEAIEQMCWWQFHFAYYHGGRSWFQQMLPKWWEWVLKMIQREQERKVLVLFYERIRSGRHWQESTNQISLWDFEIV
jgi:Phage phiEco32-like COOH.NH2 ligase-type 2